MLSVCPLAVCVPEPLSCVPAVHTGLPWSPVLQGLEDLCRGRRFTSPVLLELESENGDDAGAAPVVKRPRLGSS